MEKFIKIAESIADLTVFNAYSIVRIDIQLNTEKNIFYSFLTLEGVNGPDKIDIKINPDGSFYEIV